MNLKTASQVPFSRESRAFLVKETKPLRIRLQSPSVSLGYVGPWQGETHQT